MENLIGLWVNLSRAYEIALLGNFNIQIIFNKDYVQGFKDYEKIKSFFNDVNFVKDGNLIIEIFKPDLNQLSNSFETKDDIHKRVEKAKGNIKPNAFKNNSCDHLLKVASERLSFSLERYENVIEISKIIAQLDGSKTIEPQHIAESIQYNYSVYDNSICNAENKSINFGSGIEIALHELDHTDILNAINYLQSLIK